MFDINSTDVNTNILLRAAKNKYRFVTNKGELGFEDLFDLKLEDLDRIAVGIDIEIQKLGRTSFIRKPGANTGGTDLSAKLELVKLVIDIKQTANDLATQRAAARGKLEQLQTLLEEKRRAEMGNLSTADLEAQIEALKGAVA